METFVTVGDSQLCESIAKARKRVVYVAAGISDAVARALGSVFDAYKNVDVTVVIDPDEEVCRIGYGDQQGLQALQQLAELHHIAIRKQRGLRIGVLLVDNEVLLWAPTPQSIEAAPTEPQQPNGLRLGRDPVSSLEKAIAPEGTDTVPSAGEIGRTVVTPAEVKETIKALEANPVIPVALSQVTRVFSSKLQFVELEVKRARLSKTGLGVPKDQLNVDVADELRGLIESKFRAFSDLRNHPVNVPAFTRTGEPSFVANGKPGIEPMTEADLEAVRHEIERRLLYSIRGHGTLIARDQKRCFEQCVDAYSKQLRAHAMGLRKLIEQQTPAIVGEAVKLVANRASHAASGPLKIDESALRSTLNEAIKRLIEGEPCVTKRYKDVTFEHTQDEEFRGLVRRALPPDVQNVLGTGTFTFRRQRSRRRKRWDRFTRQRVATRSTHGFAPTSERLAAHILESSGSVPAVRRPCGSRIERIRGRVHREGLRDSATRASCRTHAA